jgi:hypothetical protein
MNSTKPKSGPRPHNVGMCASAVTVHVACAAARLPMAGGWLLCRVFDGRSMSGTRLMRRARRGPMGLIEVAQCR